MSSDQFARLVRRGRRNRQSAEAAIAMLEHLRALIDAELSEQSEQLYRELLLRQNGLDIRTKLGRGPKLLLLLTSSLLPATLATLQELLDALSPS